MTEGKKVYHKIAKGKGVFQTQLPLDLLEEIEEFSRTANIPKTLITEKLLRYGLRVTKEKGALPF